MKKILFMLLLTLGATAARAQVRFETSSTDEVREIAVANDKLVFIDLYATWCGPCRTMEREVFSRKDVGDFMDKYFVAAQYDVDQATGRALMDRYGRNSIPLYLIFNTDGELLGTLLGASTAKTFLANLQKILDNRQ